MYLKYPPLSHILYGMGNLPQSLLFFSQRLFYIHLYLPCYLSCRARLYFHTHQSLHSTAPCALPARFTAFFLQIAKYLSSFEALPIQHILKTAYFCSYGFTPNQKNAIMDIVTLRLNTFAQHITTKAIYIIKLLTANIFCRALL